MQNNYINIIGNIQTILLNKKSKKFRNLVPFFLISISFKPANFQLPHLIFYKDYILAFISLSSKSSDIDPNDNT